MKLNTRSFGFKLWIYFVIFTAFIFIILWLLQTVFLQSFYDAMVIRNAKEAAESIVSSGQEDDITDRIDELAHNNSLLVFITDTDGNVLYSSDEFKGIHNSFRFGDKKGNRDEKKEKRGEYRSLPDEYETFIDDLASDGSEENEYRNEELYLYGTYIDYCDSDEKCILLVSAAIDAVGASVSIISMQLVWVTVLSLIIAFVLSWFIARRFSSPVDRLSAKAAKLGGDNYDSVFKKGFCAELDELSDTLDKTNDKLIRARDFQMELLANVSHDLRTPVTMIKGYAEMIRDISWDDDEQSAEDLGVIIREADRLTALVNEIMEYSELKTNDMAIDLLDTDLSAVVRKTVDNFKALNKPGEIEIGYEIEDDIHVLGNSSRLERALFNLMDNAVRHTGESGKINVTLSSDGGKAVIRVTDYGNGIPASEIGHIWDRYYTSRMRSGKGVSGLGLAIVRQITDMHNGVCRVESVEGEGSSFFIELEKLTK